MTFHEDWFGPASCGVLAELARAVRHVDGKVLEIGSWEGRSTLALADAVDPDIVHAVDTWNGSTGEVSETIAAERDVYAQFCENTVGRNIEAHRMDWRDYLADERGPFRLVFIDGLHTYAEVREQLIAIAPLMSRGGILCGDDQHHPPIRRAVAECLGSRRTFTLATLWYRVI